MVGLSGSSAIIVAAFKALLRFYSLSLEGDLGIETARFPQVVLDVEMAELGITAGLQDRVIQVSERTACSCHVVATLCILLSNT